MLRTKLRIIFMIISQKKQVKDELYRFNLNAKVVSNLLL